MPLRVSNKVMVCSPQVYPSEKARAPYMGSKTKHGVRFYSSACALIHVYYHNNAYCSQGSKSFSIIKFLIAMAIS